MLPFQLEQVTSPLSTRKILIQRGISYNNLPWDPSLNTTSSFEKDWWFSGKFNNISLQGGLHPEIHNSRDLMI
jgi:hypothetical protein